MTPNSEVYIRTRTLKADRKRISSIMNPVAPLNSTLEMLNMDRSQKIDKQNQASLEKTSPTLSPQISSKAQLGCMT